MLLQIVTDYFVSIKSNKRNYGKYNKILYLLFTILFDSLNSLNCALAAAKACKSQVALAHLSKAASRSSYYVALFQKLVEEGPACKALWNLQPDIWRIEASKGLEPGRADAFKNYAGIFAVEGKVFLNLLLTSL